MEGFNLERRGLFDGLKVPVTGNAVLLGALGILVFWVGIMGMQELFDLPGDGVCRMFEAMLGNLSTLLGWPGTVLARLGGWTVRWTSYPGYVWVGFFAWTIAVWAFFAGAISRIAAMKLAREEGLELRDALRFGGKKFLSNLGAVAFVLVIMGFFYLVTNATIAGGLARLLPFGIGNVVLGLLFFFVLVSSFLIVLVGALGIIGCNLASAAIATEVSDAFDGVSRAWDYVVARPWNLILTYVATFAYMAVVLVLGNLFLDVSVRSLSVGWWGLGEAPYAVPVGDPGVRAQLVLPSDLAVVYLPGRASFIYHRVIGKRFRPDQNKCIFFGQGIECAIERYKEDTHQLPGSLRDLITQPHHDGKALEGWGGKDRQPYLLLTDPPTDRWNQPYRFRVPGRGGKPYDVYSLGADGKESDDDIVGIPPEGIAVGYGPEVDIAPLTESSLAFAARGVSIWQNVARLLLFGYVVAYFFCSQTTVYFLLRREVEGEDYTEIVLEEDLEDEADPVEFPGGAAAPAAPIPMLPPATPPTVTPTSPPAATTPPPAAPPGPTDGRPSA